MITLKKFGVDDDINLLLQGIALSSSSTLTDKNKKIFESKMKFRINDNYIYYFILNNQTIIGTICLMFKNNTISINDFAIFEKFQNNGFGNEVLNYIKNKYKDHNFELGVEKGNTKALHLYQKNGFRIYKEFSEGYFLHLSKE